MLKKQVVVGPWYKGFPKRLFQQMVALLYYELLYLLFYWYFQLVCILWYWIKPLEVLKFLLRFAHRVVSCLAESSLFCSSPFSGCWFVECSLFRWSRMLSLESICQNSLFIIFSIITREHITSQCSWHFFETFVFFQGARTNRFDSLIT